MKRLFWKIGFVLVTVAFSIAKAYAISDGTYFIKTDDGKFWMRGEPYGSAVQLFDWGLPVNVSTESGVTTLKFADASDWIIFDDDIGLYADNANPTNKTWVVTESSGKYTFKNNVNNRYARVEGSRVLSSDNASDAYAFTLVSASDHQTVLANLANAQAATAAAGEGLSANTPEALAAAVASFNTTAVIQAATPATTAEKYQGGQWDSRTVYSGSVNITTPGLYKFTMQGFYRMTDNATTYGLHTSGFDCPPVYVFFGDAKTMIASVFSASNTNSNNCYTASDGKYYPNGQTAALNGFKEGHYVNTVWVYISEARSYNYGIQYIGWAGDHEEWTCYTTESISLTLYSQDLWAPFQAALSSHATYDDISAADDATGYTTQYNIYKTYTQSTSQSDLQAAIAYMEANYPTYQWNNASIVHPVDVTEGIISGWECTSNDAWPGSGRTTATGTYYDGTSRTYFTQNHEDGPARSQTVTIPEAGAYLLRTIVRPVYDASYATIKIGDESTTTRGIPSGSNNIGNGWTYNDIYFATTSANTSKTISIALSNVNSSREADCGEMHLYYIGQSADFVKDGVHRYIGSFATAPTIVLTDEVPVANTTAATMSGASVTFTNPNGLVLASSATQVSANKNVVVGGTCANLTLTDGHPFVNPQAFTATTATYTLGSSYVAGGSFATLTLPFNASTLAGDAYAIETADLMAEQLKGTKVTSIEANKPVLVKAAGNYSGSGVTVEVVATGTTYTNGQLVGSYTATEAPANSYVLQKHGDQVAFYLVGTTRPTVGPFRAYIKAQSSNARMLKMVFDDEEVLGVESVELPAQPVQQHFDLQGRLQYGQYRGIGIVRNADGSVKKVMK